MRTGREWYSEARKDPRWQRKRLEVFARDEWQCVKCNDKTTELQVDHLFYTKGAMPWEYPMDALQTLCRNCHEIKSEMEGIIKVKRPQAVVMPRPQRFACIEAFVAAYHICKSAMKAHLMALYERGKLPAGSVERVIKKKDLKSC